MDSRVRVIRAKSILIPRSIVVNLGIKPGDFLNVMPLSDNAFEIYQGSKLLLNLPSK